MIRNELAKKNKSEKLAIEKLKIKSHDIGFNDGENWATKNLDANNFKLIKDLVLSERLYKLSVLNTVIDEDYFNDYDLKDIDEFSYAQGFSYGILEVIKQIEG